jgi:hypothetical protein
MTKIYLDNTKDAQRWLGNNTKEKEKRNGTIVTSNNWGP